MDDSLPKRPGVALGLQLQTGDAGDPARQRHLLRLWISRPDPRQGHRSVRLRVATILAVFDWLQAWFSEPGYRGCAWINGYGELGPASPAVAAQARWHKEAFRAYLRELVAAAALPEPVADSLYLLAEGAMVTAAIFTTAEPASRARSAAEQLLATARAGQQGSGRRQTVCRQTVGHPSRMMRAAGGSRRMAGKQAP